MCVCVCKREERERESERESVVCVLCVCVCVCGASACACASVYLCVSMEVFCVILRLTEVQTALKLHVGVGLKHLYKAWLVFRMCPVSVSCVSFTT